ncbi:MAG: HK97 gp10 family phage protein [Fervidobacterium sp.]
MAELKWYKNKTINVAKKEAIRAIQKSAADLQRRSVMQAPIDTGDLRANCSISSLKKTKNEIYVRVGYDLPYAIVQHENLSLNHPIGGKAKYLEDPYNENKVKYDKLIKDIITHALENEE